MLGVILLAAMPLAAPVDVDSTIYRNEYLDEVTVVEYKQNPRNLTTGSSTVLSNQQINLMQFGSMEELSAVVPNFYMPEYGSRQTTPLFIRGVGSKTKGNAVGYYVDGVPHFENTGFALDFTDIDNIEVLRGPQGTLYGRDAIGGLVNVHTKSPLTYQGTRFKLGYGNHNDVTVEGAHYAKFGDKLGLRLSGAYNHNDGFFNNATTGTKADKINDAFGRFGLYFKPSLTWTLCLSSDINYTDQNGYPYSPYDLTTEKASPISYNRESGYRRLLSASGFNARYEGARFGFNSQTSFEFAKDHQGLDQDFTPQDNYFVRVDNRQRIWSQEFTLKSVGNNRYQWIVGAFGMIQNVSYLSQVNYLTRDMNSIVDYDAPVYSAAIYHQSSYNIWRGLSASVGVRYDFEYNKRDYKASSVSLSTGAVTPGATFESGLHFHQFTPKFTLQYKTTADNLFYGSITKGYMAGGFNSLANAAGSYTYEPSYNWNYEVGTKLQSRDGRWKGELSLFYIDWRHQQLNHQITGVGNIITNAGHSDSKGVEASLAANPFKNFNFSLSYGYTHARFLSYKKSETVDYTGKLLPIVPQHTMAANANYYIYPKNTTLCDRITLHAGVTGLGRVYWYEDNDAGQDFYMLVNAKVAVTKGIFTWEVWGKNLTNSDYLTYGFKTSGYYVQKGRPLAFGTSLSVKF